MFKTSLGCCLLLVAGACLGADCQGDDGAPFLLPEFTLSVSVQGEGLVEVVSDEGNREITEELFVGGTEVTLLATPPQGWSFLRWEGDVTGEENETTVIMDGDRTITAVFAAKFTLSVTVDGGGTVELVKDGGNTEYIEREFIDGTNVTLVAVPLDGWLFAGWTGDVVGADSTITITTDTDTHVAATFTAVAGQRVVTVKGILGRMTIAINGSTIKGVHRSGRYGFDLEGTIAGDQLTMISSAPTYSDAIITATVLPNGSWEGTIDGSGFHDDPFTAEVVGFTGFLDPLAGVRTTTVEGLNGFLAIAVQDGVIKGTWRPWGDFGCDVEGTVDEDQVTFTASSPGFADLHVTATVNTNGSWTGTLNGSGFNNDPFEAQPSVFP